MADCMQFLSENRLNICQIFGLFGVFKKLNPKQRLEHKALCLLLGLVQVLYNSRHITSTAGMA